MTTIEHLRSHGEGSGLRTHVVNPPEVEQPKITEVQLLAAFKVLNDHAVAIEAHIKDGSRRYS